MRDYLSAFSNSSEEHQQNASINLQSIQISKVSKDLYCITSLNSKYHNMLIGRVSLQKLVSISKGLAEIYIEMEGMSANLASMVNNDILNILHAGVKRNYESIDDMLSHLEELELVPYLLRTELLLKNPEIYLKVFTTTKY